MSANSKIEWTEATWNPVRGCVKVSPGCKNCYAETFAERFRGVPGHPYAQGFDVRLVPEKLEEPLLWKKPRRVFVNSMSDLFQEGVLFEFIDQVFAVMALAPQHMFQVLTKRAERLRAYLADPECFERVAELAMSYQYAGNFDDEVEFDARDAHEQMAAFWPLRNVWLGVSAENQHFADERIPLLLQTPAAVRFISAEPLLGPIDIREYLTGDSTGHETGGPAGWQGGESLDWVIVGGESGPGARATKLEWIEDVVRQCRRARVPAFVKQIGSRWRGVSFRATDGGTQRIRHSRGGDTAEWPEDLRVREYPQ